MTHALDLEFVHTLQLVFPPDRYPLLYQRLHDFEWLPSDAHQETFRDHCVHTARAMERSITHALSTDPVFGHSTFWLHTWEGFTYAYLVGFLHDVGKPFVGRHRPTGHAQVGARLVDLRFRDVLPRDALRDMCLLIDLHMCCLRHPNLPTAAHLRTEALLRLFQPTYIRQTALRCLQQADAESKQPPSPVTPLTRPSPFFPLDFAKQRRVALFLLGPSGSGKTTLARQLMDHLSPDFRVIHLERDACLRAMALPGETYAECYQRVHHTPHLKQQLKDTWKHRLSHLDPHDVVILDTVQYFYWFDSSPFQDYLRIGCYLVPMHYLHAQASPRPVDFPPTQGSGYPSVLMEKGDTPSALEVGTGLMDHVPGMVRSYLEEAAFTGPLYHQRSLAFLWNRAGWEYIQSTYLPKGIQRRVEYEWEGYQVIRITYLPHSDVTWGGTRYYRGEFLLVHTSTQHATSLRGGLPTFNHSVHPDLKFHTVTLTPKWDGCLVHLLFIPVTHARYAPLHLYFKDQVYENHLGLFFVGSKHKLIADPPIRARFDEAIQGASLESFLAQFPDDLFQNSCKTLHFEVMTPHPSSELTVHYDHAFLQFIGTTEFHDRQHQFQLAGVDAPYALPQTVLTSRADLDSFLQHQHERFLHQGQGEPEGWVLYFWNARGQWLDVVKYKYPEYYAARCPAKHPEVYQTLVSKPTVASRFQRCRYLKELGTRLAPVKEDMTRVLDTVLAETENRKQFAHTLLNKEEWNECKKRWKDLKAQVETVKVDVQKQVFTHYPDKEKMVRAVFEELEAVAQQYG